jgi:hypothetical protein
MQGEVSPSDPLWRLSGAVQPTAAIIQTQSGFSKQTKARTEKRLRIMVFVRLQAHKPSITQSRI